MKNFFNQSGILLRSPFRAAKSPENRPDPTGKNAEADHHGLDIY